MKKGILIQSRLSSLRLPGKMLMQLGEYKLVEFVYNRCLLSKESDFCAVITSSDRSDDLLYDFCVGKNIPVFRGSLNNVLQRYIDASQFFNIDYICRVCGDSPFVDIQYIDEMFEEIKKKNLDYIGFDKEKIIHGLDNEVIKKDVLSSLLTKRLSNDDLEHVTYYIKNNLKKYKYRLIESDFSMKQVENIRFTVDYTKDLELCNKYFDKYLKTFDFSRNMIKDAIAKENICVE